MGRRRYGSWSTQVTSPVNALTFDTGALIALERRRHRGDLVYTSDHADLDKLGAYFPAVRILGV